MITDFNHLLASILTEIMWELIGFIIRDEELIRAIT